ncbi:uncharacterized protein MICPUCDRAFT_54586 [Micromonas pusilla CCMP1545]|uniref:Predicted protein n=1 Tax=Micromonas pusilla (strain CCMP1545) TaxID=564608 RepID=C1N9Q7_MICPC|nr:uncharacterized protein MICPUCDRAFT_54586 [Micromonas pusilla CCMP1545]EEH51111.1 predicted protein [Micromonas pusilla CCMP1545]|eukprot:XP_003064777.1 predicted protein [Micromonas pusilla CCMP1545]
MRDATPSRLDRWGVTIDTIAKGPFCELEKGNPAGPLFGSRDAGAVFGFTPEESEFSPLVAHKAACASREASYEPSVNANGDADGKPSGEVIFHNYLGIGVDAAAALRFSRLRDHSPFLFVSALTNKLLYGVLGAEDVLTRSCGDLHRKDFLLTPAYTCFSPPTPPLASLSIPTRPPSTPFNSASDAFQLSPQVTLVADGEEIALPRDAEGVILLNINSYAGGVKMWERGPRFRLGEGASEGGWWEEWWRGLRGDGGGMVMGPDADGGEKDASAGGDVLPTTNNISPRQKKQQQQRHHGEFGDSAADDGRLDVVVVRGALHLGQLNLGVSTPARLCQAKRVTLKVDRPMPMHVDGQPWEQEGPCEITVGLKASGGLDRHPYEYVGRSRVVLVPLRRSASRRVDAAAR